MKRIVTILAAVNAPLTQIGVAVAGLFLAVMTAAVMLQVASREMRAPIGWTEEMALASMVWLSFLVGPWAYRQHSFTRIDVFHAMLQPRAQHVLDLVIHVLEAILLVGAIWYAWAFFERGTSLLPALTTLLRDVSAPFIGSETAQAFTVRNYAIYVVLPAGFAGLLLVNIEHVARAVLTLLTGRDHRVTAEWDTDSHGGAEGIVLHDFDDDDPRSGGGKS